MRWNMTCWCWVLTGVLGVVGVAVVWSNTAFAELLFEDHFDGAMSHEWVSIKPTQWVENGWLHTLDTGPGLDSVAVVHDGDSKWRDYTFSVMVDGEVRRNTAGNVELRTGEILFRTSNTKWSQYFVDMTGYRLHFPDKVALVRYEQGQGTPEQLFYTGDVSGIFTDQPMEVVVQVAGPRIRASIDGKELFDVIDPEPCLYGGIGIGSIWESHTRFDDVVVAPSAFEPLLTAVRVDPPAPTPEDRVALEIAGLFPFAGFDLRSPVVSTLGNEIQVDLFATSPPGSPEPQTTPFNTRAEVGKLNDGTYDYLVDLMVDDVVGSSLRGRFRVVTPRTELLSVTIDPARPTPDDIIIVDITGTFMSEGFDVQLPLDVSVTGRDIVLDIFATSPSGSPRRQTTPFDVGTGYVRLPAGLYGQTVNLFIDNVLADTMTGSFMVGIPEPDCMLMLAFGSALVLVRRR